MMVIAIITPLWYVWKWWFDWTKQIRSRRFLKNYLPWIFF